MEELKQKITEMLSLNITENKSISLNKFMILIERKFPSNDINEIIQTLLKDNIIKISIINHKPSVKLPITSIRPKTTNLNPKTKEEIIIPDFDGVTSVGGSNQKMDKNMFQLEKTALNTYYMRFYSTFWVLYIQDIELNYFSSFDSYSKLFLNFFSILKIEYKTFINYIFSKYFNDPNLIENSAKINDFVYIVKLFLILLHSKNEYSLIINRDELERKNMTFFLFSEFNKRKNLYSIIQQGLSLPTFIELTTFDIEHYFDSYISVINNIKKCVIKSFSNIFAFLSSLKEYIYNDSLLMFLNQRESMLYSKLSKIMKDIDNYGSIITTEGLPKSINENIEKLNYFRQSLETNPTLITLVFYDISIVIKNLLNKYSHELQHNYFPKLKSELSDIDFSNEGKELSIEIKISNNSEGLMAENVNLQNIKINPDNFKFVRVIETQKNNVHGEEIFKTIYFQSNEPVEFKLGELKYDIFYQYLGELHALESQIIPFEYETYSKESSFVTLKNPYDELQSGLIVENPELFFARDEIIERIYSSINKNNILQKNNSFLLMGQKRSGKTSILYHLIRKIRNESPNTIIIDFKSINSFGSSLFSNEFKDFRKIILEFINDEINDYHKILREKMRELDFVVPIDEISSNSFEYIFARFFTRFESYFGKMYNFAIFIDEFTYIYQWIINKKVSSEFMDFWKTFITEYNINTVVVGQDYSESFISEFPEQFSSTKVIYVPYFNYENTKMLVTNPVLLTNGDNRYDTNTGEKAIKKIHELSGGSPFYTSQICYHLINYMNSQKRTYISYADVLASLDKELLNEKSPKIDGDIFDPLYNVYSKDDDDISNPNFYYNSNYNMLCKIVEKEKRYPDHYCPLADLVKKDRDKILIDGLIKRNVIIREDKKIKIVVQLFGEWYWRIGRGK